MVPCFTTSSTVMIDVFLTGVSTTMFEVLFISYKLLIVPGLFLDYTFLLDNISATAYQNIFWHLQRINTFQF